MAYTKIIGKNTKDSHQTSPGYVMTVIRWANRDTVNYESTDQEVRKPLVIINDCTQLSVNVNKSTLTPSFSAVLRAGDLNYATAIHPGDFVLINMVNWEKKAKDLAYRARNAQQINREHDGFKGLFKIQTVRRQLRVEPSTGVKQYFFVVHGFAFTELNTVMYYDQVLAKQFANSEAFFYTQLDKSMAAITNSLSQDSNAQDITSELYKVLLGLGLNQDKLGVKATQNKVHKIPISLASLLGVKVSSSPVISEIYPAIFGVWSASDTTSNNTSLANGMNPSIKKRAGDVTIYEVEGSNNKLQGWRVFKPQAWNQVTYWSIIRSYVNPTINECYSSFRIMPSGAVMPTLIFRQKPFSTEHFQSPNKVNGSTNGTSERYPYTPFLSLPRWKVSADLLYSLDLGPDEATRVNYVQVYGRPTVTDKQASDALQTATGNFFFDPTDIERHGLKPIVTSAPYDYPTAKGGDAFMARKWAYLLFDMLNGMQLKEAGTFSFVGIQEPISVGDNLEFDNAVYHIEAISHSMSIAPDGRKQFRTNVKVSHGTSLESDSTAPVYTQMEHTDRYTESKRDYRKERILPGFGEAQDSLGRENTGGEESTETKESSFTLQPNGAPGIGRLSSLKNPLRQSSPDTYEEDEVSVNKESEEG